MVGPDRPAVAPEDHQRGRDDDREQSAAAEPRKDLPLADPGVKYGGRQDN
jgi:hypothetical protein